MACFNGTACSSGGFTISGRYYYMKLSIGRLYVVLRCAVLCYVEVGWSSLAAARELAAGKLTRSRAARQFNWRAPK